MCMCECVRLLCHSPRALSTRVFFFFFPSLFESLAVVADGCSLGSAVHSVTIALRHFALGVDPTAAYWDFDLLDGHGGWRAEGCHITGSGGNTTTIHCTHHNNFAVLMVSSLHCVVPVPFIFAQPCPPHTKCLPLLRAYSNTSSFFFFF